MINGKYACLTLIQISVNYCKYFVSFLAIFRVFLFWPLKYFAQYCRIDPVNFLNPETLTFPVVYNMSLCNYFSCRPQNQQNSTGLFADNDFSDVCSFIFKENHVLIEEDHPSEKNVTVKEELDGY